VHLAKHWFDNLAVKDKIKLWAQSPRSYIGIWSAGCASCLLPFRPATTPMSSEQQATCGPSKEISPKLQKTIDRLQTRIKDSPDYEVHQELKAIANRYPSPAACIVSAYKQIFACSRLRFRCSVALSWRRATFAEWTWREWSRHHPYHAWRLQNCPYEARFYKSRYATFISPM